MTELKIICNGESRLVSVNTTVAALIAELGLEQTQLAVELDGRVLTAEGLDNAMLTENSRLELIRFVGGG
ncbi:MAG: sulfur carrier protein ThiS [Desulfobulbaceae bacterium]|nr:MAG: sulfur carrier protein ThiS [Desulfobulbaceae bacterium]